MPAFYQYLSASMPIKIQIGLTFLVPAYPGCSGKEAVKWVSVCLKPCLHDTTCCQTGLSTGYIVYTAGYQTGLTTQFDNRLNEQWLFVQPVVKPGCTTGLTTVLNE